MVDKWLFPPSARYCAVRTDVPTLTNFDGLHPLEQALVAHAVDKRKAEFGDARWCAHEVLRELGRDTGEPILRGDRGMPLWPASVSGSLTHTEGLRAAVAAPRLLVRSMGLDAEPAEPLPEGVVNSIAREGEMERIDALRGEHECIDRVLFCAKEATYKSWFPLTHRWLGFEQAEIDLRPDGTFISYLLIRPTPVPYIEGRWAIHKGYILASTFVA